MDTILKMVKQEYGKYFLKKPQEEQIAIIAEVSKNYIGAIDYLRNLKNKNNGNTAQRG